MAYPEWLNTDHSDPCALCQHGIGSHNIYSGVGECYGPNGIGGICACRGYQRKERVDTKLTMTIDVDDQVSPKLEALSASLRASAARPIEWLAVGILLWIIADIAPVFNVEHALEQHAVFSALGAAAIAWAGIRWLSE